MNRKIRFLIIAIAAAAVCLSAPGARAESEVEKAAKAAKAADKAADAAEKAAKEAQDKADAAEKKDAEKKGKEPKKSDADKAADDAAKAADDAAKEADDAKDKAEKAKEDADAAKKDSDNAGSDPKKKEKAKKAADDAAAAGAAAAGAENGYPPSPKGGPAGLPGSGGTTGASGSNGKPGSGGAEGDSKKADDKAEEADKKDHADDREIQRLKKEAREKRRIARAARRAARKALRDLAALIAQELSKAGKSGAPPPSPLEGPIKDLEGLKKKAGADNLPLPPGSNTQLAQLIDAGSVMATVAGTGETIGHVADATLKNLTTRTLNLTIPPTVLISGSGNRQDYALTGDHGATVGPGESVTIPLDGVCLDARRPAVTAADTDELSIADPNTMPKRLRDQLAGAQRVLSAARSLQAAGKFKTPYSGNSARELATIIQWTTWVGVAQTTGNPLTKADFADKVYEQAGLPTVAGGLVRAGFTVPQGKIKVYLPDDMAAGDTISGTVAAEPKGATAAEHKKNADELNGYVVEFAGQKVPASSRMLTGVVPASFAANPTLTLVDAKGTTVKKVDLPQPTKSSAKKTAPNLSNFQLPTIGQVGRPLEITGPFDGNASNTSVKLGEQELPILAETTRQIIVQPPSGPIGPVEITLKEGERLTKGTFASKNAVDMPATKTAPPKPSPSGPQQQKLDKGIDDLWDAIQLTGSEAKVL